MNIKEACVTLEILLFLKKGSKFNAAVNVEQIYEKYQYKETFITQETYFGKLGQILVLEHVRN